MAEIHWLEEPQAHDFDATRSYLTLVLGPREARRLADELRRHRHHLRHFAAKDLLRAAQLEPLPATSEGVAAKLAKVAAGEPLSPVLVVEREDEPLVIADGYHRISAAYIVDESTEVPTVFAPLHKES